MSYQVKAFISLLHAALGHEVIRVHRAGLLSTSYPPLDSAIKRAANVVGRPMRERHNAERLVGAELLRAMAAATSAPLFDVSDAEEQKALVRLAFTTMQFEWDDGSLAREALATARAEAEHAPERWLDRLRAFVGRPN